jgi:hypothetical protein
LRAILTGADTASAADLTVRARSPVLALCRKLIEAGHNASQPLHVYRGDKLALIVRSIGAGAALTVAENERWGPRFTPWKPMPDMALYQNVAARTSQNEPTYTLASPNPKSPTSDATVERREAS